MQFLLQIIDQIPEWSIGPVPDFVPLKGAEIVVGGLYGQLLATLAMLDSGRIFEGGGPLTVIDHLLLRGLVIITIEDPFK